MTVEEVLECLCHPGCRKFIGEELKAKGVAAPTDADWVSVILDLLPVVFEIIRRWRERNPPNPAPLYLD